MLQIEQLWQSGKYEKLTLQILKNELYSGPKVIERTFREWKKQKGFTT